MLVKIIKFHGDWYISSTYEQELVSKLIEGSTDWLEVTTEELSLLEKWIYRSNDNYIIISDQTPDKDSFQFDILRAIEEQRQYDLAMEDFHRKKKEDSDKRRKKTTQSQKLIKKLRDKLAKLEGESQLNTEQTPQSDVGHSIINTQNDIP